MKLCSRREDPTFERVARRGPRAHDHLGPLGLERRARILIADAFRVPNALAPAGIIRVFCRAAARKTAVGRRVSDRLGLLALPDLLRAVSLRRAGRTRTSAGREGRTSRPYPRAAEWWSSWS